MIANLRTHLHRIRTTKEFYKDQDKDLYAKSYSQEGEDMVIRSLLFRKPKGFYVDIGAHHIKRFSNTMHFYEQGWHGINVDALPGSMHAFNVSRPRDINVECGVGKKGLLDFYIYDEPAVNTFDSRTVEKRKKDNFAFKVIKKIKVEVLPLYQVLDSYLPKDQHIDFISIDVEGKDLEVLNSNNWKKYKPDYILLECYGVTMLDLIKHDGSAKYLSKLGYTPIAKTKNTVFFQNDAE